MPLKTEIKLLKIDFKNMKKKTKKIKKNSFNKIDNQNKEQNKTTAKIVLTVFGLGPIIGIIIFLASRGFFNSP